MRQDPPIPEDGSCAVCGKPRRPERSRRYTGPQAELDPFCSTTCARAYHGNPLPVAPTTGEDVRRSPLPWKHGTEWCYTEHRCRCEPCTTAARVARAKRRERAA